MNETLEQAGLPAPVETADENAELNTPAATAADGEVEEPKQAERTFTQAELDAAIQKRLLKEERRVHRRVEQHLRAQAQAQTAQVEPRREAFGDDEQYLNAQIEHRAALKADQLLAQREKEREAHARTEAFLAKAEAASERYAESRQSRARAGPHRERAGRKAETENEQRTGAHFARRPWSRVNVCTPE
jgi:hypothetical protein